MTELTELTELNARQNVNVKTVRLGGFFKRIKRSSV